MNRLIIGTKNELNTIYSVLPANDLVLNKIPFVNYYKAMVDENQALNPQYTKDGVHPTGEGHDIMEPLIKDMAKVSILALLRLSGIT